MLTREILLQLLGPLPVKAAPELDWLEAVDCGSYVRHKISYAAEPGERIEAFLCVPSVGSGPYPAVYCFHQHAGERLLGKSEVVGLAGAPDQAYAHELAERGYVTLAPDAICFESRARTEDPVGYHVHALFSRLLHGQTLLGKVLFDVSAGLDVLMALPAVDGERLGFLGHSYGGRMALFAPVFDRRIRAAVSSCGSTSFQEMLDYETGVQLDFVVPGLLAHGDLGDVVRLVNPASLLILGATEDKWSLAVETLVAYAAPAFTEGALAGAVLPGPHQFGPALRSEAYAFLDTHLGLVAPAG